MNALSAAEMLNVWERGLDRPPAQRSLLLLAAACPELSGDAIASLSVGARDRRLLSLRARLFGPRLVNNAACPHCAERIEWEQNVADLLIEDNGAATEPVHGLSVGPYRLRFRLPTALDMTAIETLSANAALQLLLQRCILSADCGGLACGVEALPENVIDALNRRIESLDPQAEIRIRLTCPDCGQAWNVWFDIAGFLWREIEAWAEKLLQSVHKLAKAYGWTEREILSLSPIRRQLYLGMVGA